jgi:hypothetical protein
MAITEPDIWGTTRKMVELYGSSAHQVAVKRAERMITEGNIRGSARWHEISSAIRNLQDRRRH